MALGEASSDAAAVRGDERRTHDRVAFETPVAAAGSEGPFVLIGRDLSPGGMRIERHPDLALGDRLELVLHGPTGGDPIRVDAEVARDDGPSGFGLVFDRLTGDDGERLEKMVACLPDVESLEDGELAGLGAILSEIVEERRAGA